MTIRITGMNSGLDTEAIITELASARSMKVENIKKDQTKLSWKIDAWKELNKKIYDFYSDVLSDMRFDYAYSKKTTKVSDPDVVSVVTGGNVVNGTQTLKVNKIAKTAYLTGGKIEAQTDEKLLANFGLGENGEPIKFKVKVGDEEKELSFTGNQTLKDVADAFKEVGLDANFDLTSGRFFISSKKSGAENSFTLSAVEGDGKEASEKALKALGLYYDPDDPMMENGDKKEGQATMIFGSDAEIELNGALFTSSSNTFEINGLTLTVNKETKDGEIVTLNTQQDTDAIYDTIKNFFVKYNELINEMDKLYNAESASKYEPLTKEEKEALSDDEVEEWEKKIKESLLRRDGTLSSVSSVMKEVMLSTFVTDINGKNEGDLDIGRTEKNPDKLKKAIANEPETVIEFFKKLSNNLYDKLTEKMARTDYSSAFTIYNDKQMDIELKSYDSKIAKEQDKLNDYIDRWYKKFSQMEVALSKLNSQESSISSLFG